VVGTSVHEHNDRTPTHICVCCARGMVVVMGGGGTHKYLACTKAF
jgi:hypothetical protein